MPRRDHRGPNGEGPRTGRGLGFCRGAGGPKLARQGATSQEGQEREVGQGGRGAGRGGGGGRHGWRRRHLFHATGLTGWQREADRMTAELDEIRQQVQALQNRQASTDQLAVEEPVS